MKDIEQEYVRRHPNSEAQFRAAGSKFPNGLTTLFRAAEPFPIYFDRAQGSRKWDLDGNEFLDFVGGHGSLLLGHAHPAVVEAVSRQIAAGSHYGAGHPLEVRWADLITEIVPGSEKVSIHNSGTEASMMAVRMARASTGKMGLIKLASHNNGWHDSVSGVNVPDQSTPVAAGVPSGLLERLHVLPEATIENVQRILDQDSDIAAVILEPTLAPRGRQIPVSPDFLRSLRQLTEEAGIFLIFDEIVTGFRIPPGTAQEQFGIRPDLTLLGKILGGGLPAGAVTGSAEAMSVAETSRGDEAGKVRYQGTFNANPVTAAAAVATLEAVKEGAAAGPAELCARLIRGMNQVLETAKVPGAAWCHSSIFNFVVGTECPKPANLEWDSDSPPPIQRGPAHPAFTQAMVNRGVQFMSTGYAGFVSTAHTEQDIDTCLQAFEGTLGDLKAAGVL